MPLAGCSITSRAIMSPRVLTTTSQSISLFCRGISLSLVFLLGGVYEYVVDSSLNSSKTAAATSNPQSNHNIDTEQGDH